MHLHEIRKVELRRTTQTISSIWQVAVRAGPNIRLMYIMSSRSNKIDHVGLLYNSAAFALEKSINLIIMLEGYIIQRF